MKAAIILNGLALIAFSAVTALAFWQAYAQPQILEQFQSAAGSYEHDTYYVNVGYGNAVLILIPTMLLLGGFALQLTSYRRGRK